MQKLIFLSLISLCSLSHAMDLQRLQQGDKAIWQEKTYIVTNRIEQNSRLKLVMMRDTHKVCNAALVQEYVTCSYHNGQLEYTTSRQKPSLLCINTTVAAAIGWACVLFLSH